MPPSELRWCSRVVLQLTSKRCLSDLFHSWQMFDWLAISLIQSTFVACSDLHFHSLYDIYVYHNWTSSSSWENLKIVSYTTSTYVLYVYYHLITSFTGNSGFCSHYLWSIEPEHIVKLSDWHWSVFCEEWMKFSHTMWGAKKLTGTEKKRESVILRWLKWHVVVFF